MRERLVKIGGVLMLSLGWPLLIGCLGGIVATGRYMPEDERSLTVCFMLLTIGAFAWMMVASGKQMLRNEPLGNTPKNRRIAYGGGLAILLATAGVVLSELRLGSTAGIGFALVVTPGILAAMVGTYIGARRNARI
jgi:hypothetical protein